MKILFISHTFPPIFGGVERQNYYLSENLKKIADVTVIANSKGKAWLPLFLPYAFAKAFFLMFSYDACLLGNGVLGPIGATLKLFHPRKKFFSVFMVGNQTIIETVKIGINEEHCIFIPNGISIKDLTVEESRSEMERIFGSSLEGKKLIISIGRIVPHKGVEWFLRNVMPVLPENYCYIAAGGIVSANTVGDKSNYENCLNAIDENGLGKRAKIIGNIVEQDKLTLINSADLYVSSNIKVPGSMEGFGLTTLEGAACGRFVLASNLEGLKDAIQDGKSGFLLENENVSVWKDKVIEVLNNDSYRKEFGEKARKYVAENYSWESIAKKYMIEIEKIVSEK
ncbi:MAG: Glycosyl transferase, group 1 family [Parcubacteria group bacterium GW2011_GWC1_38_22]|nr:MAG: Glycosyl transferase, group 1 family [Parcubacteria group bacterium GW2011_GWC1_38_22]